MTMGGILLLIVCAMRTIMGDTDWAEQMQNNSIPVDGVFDFYII